MARTSLDKEYQMAPAAPVAAAASPASFEDEYALAEEGDVPVEEPATPEADTSADFLTQIDTAKVRDMAASKDYAGIGRYITELINKPINTNGQAV